jgi:thioredoxin 1
MKDKLFYIIAGIFLVAFYFYNNPKVDFVENSKEGIQFKHENWSSILSQAKDENKLVFVDVYATWCGPCKKLKKYTFSDDEVGQYFNANFVNIALDAEKGEGINIANRYEVNAYPTVLILNSDGELIAKKTGYQNSADLMSFGKRIVSSN